MTPTETLKYYSRYSHYSMNTTIQISQETKELISTFGTKEDTYDTIVRRLYDLACKEQISEFLMSDENTITLEEARRIHKKRWSR